MVERIKGLQPELQIAAFCQMEILEHGSIPSLVPRPLNPIPWRIALPNRPLRNISDTSSVEPLRKQMRRIGIRVTNKIRPRYGATTRAQNT